MGLTALEYHFKLLNSKVPMRQPGSTEVLRQIKEIKTKKRKKTNHTFQMQTASSNWHILTICPSLPSQREEATSLDISPFCDVKEARRKSKCSEFCSENLLINPGTSSNPVPAGPEGGPAQERSEDSPVPPTTHQPCFCLKGPKRMLSV